MGKGGGPPAGGYAPDPKNKSANESATLSSQGLNGNINSNEFNQMANDPNNQVQQIKNPYQLAAEGQSDASQGLVNQQTWANRPNQNTDYGSTNWSQDAKGNWTQNTSLNGALGAANQGLQAQAAANAGHPMDNGTGARNQAITGAYNQATSRLDPQWGQRQEQLQSQLVNQGLDPSSAAAQQANAEFGRDRNDAYSSAMSGAIGQGTAAQQATFNENMQAQMAPYQQMSALHGLQQMPTFGAANLAQTPQYLQGAEAYNNYSQAANAQSNQQGADIASGAATIGGAAIMASSDERLKKNIKRLPVDAIPGVPLATFEFKHDPGTHHLGVIAQDVEKVAPQHVEQGPDGIRKVNYAALMPFGMK